MKNSTLHICNYSEVLDKSFYSKLVDKNDSIVFFAKYLSKEQYAELLKLFHGTTNNINFIIEDNKNDIPTIEHSDWIVLINNHKRSFTWK